MVDGMEGGTRPMSPTFEITIECGEFDVDQIWPDGDAPNDPTVEDVIAVIKQSPTLRQMVMFDWSLLNDSALYVNGQHVRFR